ncbi:MAG: gamma carbonic anhydrase family protein [Bacteroidota bacterium]
MPVRAHRGKSPQIPPSAMVAPGAYLIGDVRLGEEASVWFECVLRADINAILVGDRSNIQDGCVIHVTHERPAVVGQDVTVGHRAVLHACTVEDCCLVGMGSVVLDGARIGPLSVVAAGAVVLQEAVIPGGSLAAGVPARVIRPLTPEEKRRLEESARDYVEFAREFRIPPTA